MKNLKAKASDIISLSIASWTFVFVYTVVMLIWIILHVNDILHIDSDDFIKYNLFLSWFAGIQASIVLMSSNRQSERDRRTIIKGIELDKQQLEQDLKESKKTTTKLNQIIKKIESLEEILSLVEEEEELK